MYRFLLLMIAILAVFGESEPDDHVLLPDEGAMVIPEGFTLKVSKDDENWSPCALTVSSSSRQKMWRYIDCIPSPMGPKQYSSNNQAYEIFVRLSCSNSTGDY